MGNGRSFIAGVLFLIGVLAIIAGVIYLVEPAHSLPSFFPGHVSIGGLGKHKKRGEAGIGVGVVLLIIAVALLVSGRSTRIRAARY